MIRKQNESNKELKKKERKQNREDLVEDIDLSKFFEIATSDKLYVNSLNLHEFKANFYKNTQAILKLLDY